MDKRERYNEFMATAPSLNVQRRNNGVLETVPVKELFTEYANLEDSKYDTSVYVINGNEYAGVYDATQQKYVWKQVTRGDSGYEVESPLLDAYNVKN